jgi:hypothetical protein
LGAVVFLLVLPVVAFAIAITVVDEQHPVL